MGLLELADDLGRQAAVRGYLEPLLLGPGPDLAATLPAGRRPDGHVTAPVVHPPGVLDKGRQPMAQIGRVLGAQIQFVRPAIQAELDGLVGRPPGQVVFQLYLEPLHRPPRADGRGKKAAAGEHRSYPRGRGSIAAGIGQLAFADRDQVIPACRSGRPSGRSPELT
jgi:hypothetical protein